MTGWSGLTTAHNDIKCPDEKQDVKLDIISSVWSAHRETLPNLQIYPTFPSLPLADLTVDRLRLSWTRVLSHHHSLLTVDFGTCFYVELVEQPARCLALSLGCQD